MLDEQLFKAFPDAPVGAGSVTVSLRRRHRSHGPRRDPGVATGAPPPGRTEYVQRAQ